MERFNKDKRHVDEYQDPKDRVNKGSMVQTRPTFEELIVSQINQCKEERTSVLRSNVVDKYIIDILKDDRKKKVTKFSKLDVVKKMLFFRMDNRVLNNMRQVMNEMIKDERGLMSRDDF